MGGKETDSPNPSALTIPDFNDPGDNGRTVLEKLVEDTADSQYPHGLKLVLLAGASIVAVFLIALDQVSLPAP